VFQSPEDPVAWTRAAAFTKRKLKCYGPHALSDPLGYFQAGDQRRAE